ncbi:MAG TPA: efflux RND transporter periplasmic adaptor subunit [Steroidobacteraceae bacterium]|nr:efflux RND transporter periplasmic adaptor subunit [Steroidobacteraceae bacterium]
MTRGGKILLAAGVVALLALPVVLKNMGGGEAKEVEMVAVESRVITPTILASGSLTYQTEIRLGSEVMGRVKALYVKEGDPVKAGQTVLRLDPATLQTQVDALEAALRQSRLSIQRAQVAMDTIETKWKRYEQLRTSGVIDANTYDEVRSQRDQARVELNVSNENATQTEARLNEAREQLAKTELRAPIDGRVTQLIIKEGETAVPSATSIAGSDLMTISDISNMYAEVNVNETDVARVVPGQTARIVPAAFPDQSWEGVVETVAVSPRTVQGQGKSYPVKIRLNATENMKFHTGMSCRAEIATRAADTPPVPAVPVQAVQYEDSQDRNEPAKASVFVVDNGVARKVPVEVDIADDTWIAVKKGLAPGGRIAAGPPRVLRFLRDGDRVKEKAAATEGAGTSAAGEAVAAPASP